MYKLLLQNVQTIITECTLNYYKMYTQLLQNVQQLLQNVQQLLQNVQASFYNYFLRLFA